MIRVSIQSRDRAVVVTEPSIWERLLLRSTQERIAVAFPSPNGTLCWYWDATGRPVGHDVYKAIDAEVVRLEWERLAEKWRAR